MSTQEQISAAAEALVSAWLVRSGYRTNFDTRPAGTADIEAIGSKASLLVQVKAVIAPSAPPDLSDIEVEQIKARAAKKPGYQAWQAKLAVDSDLNLIGEILWKRLV